MTQEELLSLHKWFLGDVTSVPQDMNRCEYQLRVSTKLLRLKQRLLPKPTSGWFRQRDVAGLHILNSRGILPSSVCRIHCGCPLCLSTWRDPR